ncbi:hypothetical protein [Tropicimonas sp. IMCC34011]|uniref:hypothetical protein n=1 Tax=Tropicimonas sp. IMCC34011 TaxID=2248759 RepID=UPI0018E53FA2|nr:hypothetical protein [Tropicimonas sp. IMCC34011]
MQLINLIHCGTLPCGAIGFAEVLISVTSTSIRWFPCDPARAPSNGMILEREWRKILPDLRAGSFDCVRIDPIDYDLWLDRRLSQGIVADDTWLASQPVFPAITLCEFIGAALLRKQREAPDDRCAKATGFAPWSAS